LGKIKQTSGLPLRMRKKLHLNFEVTNNKKRRVSQFKNHENNSLKLKKRGDPLVAITNDN